MRFLAWNRAQKDPLVKPGFEYAVFDAALLSYKGDGPHQGKLTPLESLRPRLWFNIKNTGNLKINE